MNQQEFINKVIGLPWVNRASSFDEVDCWGLVTLYYKHVLGIDLPIITGYAKGECDTSHGWQSGINQWQQMDRPSVNGLLFTCYKGDEPSHVGITISAIKVLHARGFVGCAGKVEIHSIRAIESIYGKITLHKFIGQVNA